MSVDCLDRIIVRDRDVVGLDAYHLAVLLVGPVHREESASTSALIEEPEIRQGCGERCGDGDPPGFEQVGNQIVCQQKADGRVRREQQGEDVGHGHVGS